MRALQPCSWAVLSRRALLLLVLYQSILQELSIACDIYAGVVVGFKTIYYFLSSIDHPWFLVIVDLHDNLGFQRLTLALT